MGDKWGMENKTDSVIHELAVNLAVQNWVKNGGKQLSTHEIRNAYLNYLLAVKTMSETDPEKAADEKSN